MDEKKIQQAIELLRSADHVTVFTGAGISVESGIPPFRGKNGIWNTIDPQILEMGYFQKHPEVSWPLIKKIFFDTFKNAEPNMAHKNIATLESMGIVKSIITQNIDNLHQRAGSKNVIEFHGNSRKLVCLKYHKYIEIAEEVLDDLPPRCPYCSSVLKPDFVFFGESIPEPARSLSFQEADLADMFLLIGTTGVIQPASQLPLSAKANGAKVIEINTTPSEYTSMITDVFLQGKSTSMMEEILKRIMR